MTEPDPKPQEEATAMGNDSVETVKDGKEKNGIEEDPNGKANNDAGETKEGGHKSDLKEMDGMEETKEKEGKNGIINGVKKTKEGGNKDSVKDVNGEKDTKKVEEKMTTEENEGADKTRDAERKTIVEEINDSREKEGSEVKKNEEGKMYKEKRVGVEEAGEGEKGIEDVEMVEAEDVKEEDRVGTDERTEDEVKPGGMDDEKEKEDGGSSVKEVDDSTKTNISKKKRSRSGRKVGERVEAKEKKEEAKKAGEANEKKEGMKKLKEKLSSPTPSSMERPVRERKTVQRLVEVIEKEPNKGVVIEKGRGTPLKNIPNVAHKLARKKPGDLKLLHQTLFGRKGKAFDFKNHILQFSGFAWHESDEKQRAKVKEKLDKCVKNTLLDLCDLLDISVSKTNSRKEDLITKLLDFMASPHAANDVLLAEKEQQSRKSRKRKIVARGSASKGTEDTSAKRSGKKRIKSEGTPSSKQRSAIDTDDEDEDGDEHKEDSEHGVPDEDEELEHSESEKESESKEADEKDEDEDKAEAADEDSGKGKQGMKQSPKKQKFSKKEKVKMESSSKKTPPVTTAKSPTKTPASTQSKPDERNDVGEKVFVRKKKNVDPPKKKSTSKSDAKEKSGGKRSAGSKTKSGGAGQSNPSKEELRKAICEILKKVDFNSATFTDILKQLAICYKVDLTPRKAAIKLIIREELTKLAVETEDNEDAEDEQDSEKEEHREPDRQEGGGLIS